MPFLPLISERSLYFVPLYKSLFNIQDKVIQDIWIVPSANHETFCPADFKDKFAFHSVDSGMAVAMNCNPGITIFDEACYCPAASKKLFRFKKWRAMK
jgi:hypothetical protein